MFRKSGFLLLCGLLLGLIGSSTTLGQRAATPEKRKVAKEDRNKRDQSLREITKQLGVGPGNVIADIGAGNGPDTWVFAEIVTESGKVLAEEIDESKTKAIEKEAAKRKLAQVNAILGKSDDPSLPAGAVDMAFMHLVYHHFSQPREMLQAIWKSLKPGGKLVIVDQRLGTLADWVPRAERAKKHYWTAETTVVREAREQGFRFFQCGDSWWHEKQAFVLVFERPADLQSPDRDPDALSPIPDGVLGQLTPQFGAASRRAAFVALGEGRRLIGPILKSTDARGVDIVLEEWATQKDERPPVDAGLELPSVLTEKGDPHLPQESLDAVYFLDSYHLLFHGPTLLAKLRERLVDDGRVYILDRRATRDVTRREASHRRMIAPNTVKDEMAQAGFRLARELPLDECGRFLMTFERNSEPIAK